MLSRQTVRFATLVVFLAVFEAITIVVSKFGTPPQLDPIIVVSFVGAASLGGSALAYLTIFEWLRAPFIKVVTHATGEGEDTEPRTDRGPVVEVIGSWLCCPVCAGTWVTLVLYSLYAFFPVHGRTTVVVFGIAGFASVLTRGRELLEWSRHHKQWQTGTIASRYRDREENNVHLFTSTDGGDNWEETGTVVDFLRMHH